MLNEDVLISRCTNFTEAEFKFLIIYCSRLNVQLAELDLTLPCDGQFCTELR